MAVVNSLPKDKNAEAETCKDLAQLFIHKIMTRSSRNTIWYEEIHIVFGCYVTDSLKNKTRKGNTKISEILRTHDHEEADSLIILHSSIVDRNVLLPIVASDTDVLLQLIQRYPHIPGYTVHLGKSNEYSIKDIYKDLGEKRYSALVGFHVFTGCGVSGKFAGRTKELTFKKFMDADNEIYDALENLGKSEEKPTLKTIENLERFVSFLYE